MQHQKAAHFKCPGELVPGLFCKQLQADRCVQRHHVQQNMAHTFSVFACLFCRVPSQAQHIPGPVHPLLPSPQDQPQTVSDVPQPAASVQWERVLNNVHVNCCAHLRVLTCMILAGSPRPRKGGTTWRLRSLACQGCLLA